METFINFVKNQKNIWKVSALVCLAILVLCFASSVGKRDRADSKTVNDDIAEQLEDVCSSVVGVGKCRVYVNMKKSETRFSKENGKVEGICVVCEGGDNEKVRRALTEMLSSLFGIGSNRVTVVKLK